MSDEQNTRARGFILLGRAMVYFSTVYTMDVVVNSGHWMTDCPYVTLYTGLNQPSQATFGECSPQSNVDGVEIDCRR